MQFITNNNNIMQKWHIQKSFKTFILLFEYQPRFAVVFFR